MQDSAKRLQKIASSAYERNPQSQNTELLWILISGCLLLFLGTTTSYIVYAVTATEMYQPRRSPLPIVTDMIRDWPLLSSCFLGVGATLLFTGMLATAISRIPYDVGFKPRTMLVRLCITALGSIWIVIASSGYDRSVSSSFDWVHHASTFVFMASAVWALHTANHVCYFFIQAIQDRQLGGQSADNNTATTTTTTIGGTIEARLGSYEIACNVCAWTGVIAVIGGTVSAGAAALLEDQTVKGYLWQGLAVAELLLILTSGVGFSLVVYMYSEIETLAAEVVTIGRSANPTTRQWLLYR